jgi:hypothetical protein
MAAQDAPAREHASTPWAMALDCLDGIMRAGRFKAAIIAEHWRQAELVEPDCSAQHISNNQA